MNETKQVSLKVPSIGRQVHYVLPLRSELRPHIVGEHRPATVIKVWGENDPDAAVQLCVLLDGTNDKEGWSGETFWVTSTRHDELNKETGSWHFPEPVPDVVVTLPDERDEETEPPPKMTPWQVWEKRDGTLSVPIYATREDLCRLANKILEYAAQVKE